MKLIDGDELIELLLSTAITDKQREYSECVQYAVQKIPAVDAVPVRHGKWKHKKDLKQFFCDQCGEPSLTEDDVYFYGMEFPNFCPNCGADMRKDGERHG